MSHLFPPSLFRDTEVVTSVKDSLASHLLEGPVLEGLDRAGTLDTASTVVGARRSKTVMRR